MKILFINYQALPVPPVKGGAVEYLIDSFLKYNEENHLHDITLYSIYDKEAEIESKKYKHTTFRFIKIEGIKDKIDRGIRFIANKYTPFDVGNAYISKVIKNEKNFAGYDVIIVENSPGFILPLSKKYKGKIILHHHNDFLTANTKRYKKIFKRCDGIYTISDSLGDCVQKIAKDSKVKTLYNGVDLNKFKENDDLRIKMRHKYGIEDGDILFMYCGRLVPDKGVLELVKAFSRIKKEHVKLMLVGGVGYSQSASSPYLEEIKKYADENVIFTGFLPYSQMPDIYPMADVGVVPSIFNDPFNLTCIEFCANKKPVIISDRGAMKELVNESCSIIAKYDKEKFSDNIYASLLEMLERDTLKMGEEAQKVALNFSIEKYCERFKKLLEEISKE